MKIPKEKPHDDINSDDELDLLIILMMRNFTKRYSQRLRN